MNTFVEGSYLTIKEVDQKVETLLTQGYDKKDMTLVTSSRTKDSIETDIPVKVYGQDSDDDSMIDKIKHLFTGSDDTHTDDADQKLLHDYETELDNGRLILLVDENENAGRKTSTGSNHTNNSDMPVVDPVNQGADIVVEDDDHTSENHSITPADHPDIDPTDPAHTAGKKDQYTNEPNHSAASTPDVSKTAGKQDQYTGNTQPKHETSSTDHIKVDSNNPKL
ncbi:general stress protein [Marinilactibacillus kalidii]|uniref:general stress protein n=1 Tax=Marinilactibacillus kalidii TaxID=2820274 RepID=UPI001ABE358F|nr:general stress protein [Marinilactibacillus kalidii]